MDANSYIQKSADWREQLRKNERRTKVVIFLFILIYFCLGLLIDLILYWEVSQAPLLSILQALLTFNHIPYVTMATIAVAIISVLITYSLHDRIMLLGTQYKEITPDSKSLEERQLFNVVEELKIASGLRFMPKIYIISAEYMNAFASGYSEKSALIAVTNGLLRKLNRSELQAVMAHELSHIRHHDIKLTLMASVLSNIILIFLDILFYSVLYGSQRRLLGRFAIVIIVLRYLLPVITVILMLYLSRTREYMADAGCVELMRDNDPLASALLKIHQDHQENKKARKHAYGHTAHEEVRRAAYLYDPVSSGIEPVKDFTSWISTHPKLEDRLKAIGYYKKEI